MTDKVAGIRLAVIGWGAIARSQHAAALAADPGFALVGMVSPAPDPAGPPRYEDLDDLLANHPDLEAVSICTPPGPRFEIAREALSRGLHVMLEKPPAATVLQARMLSSLAQEAGRTVFAAWHSRQARGVAAARAWLADRAIGGFHIAWREDVTRWHPGQDWIWRAPGMGVFDPGVNALSILTEILPVELAVIDAVLGVVQGHETPIAAWMRMSTESGAEGLVHLDWREAGDQTWTITVDTEAGVLRLTDGGARLEYPGHADSAVVDEALGGEYPGLYRRFGRLIGAGRSEVDLRPLQLAADAFLCGRRITVSWPAA
jgi:D-galactose 1-dehydrogenase